MLSNRTFAAITALLCAASTLAHAAKVFPPGTDHFTINGRDAYVILPAPEDVVPTGKIPADHSHRVRRHHRPRRDTGRKHSLLRADRQRRD